MTHSIRFNLQIVLTAHEAQRLTERKISNKYVLAIINSETPTEFNGLHYPFYINLPDRSDNVPCVTADIDNIVVVKTIMHRLEPQPRNEFIFKNDYILRIRASQISIEREASQGFKSNSSYAVNSSIAGIVLRAATK